MDNPQVPHITSRTRWFFGSGGLVYGVVTNAHYFVLVYYSQILGLSPHLAGLALGIGFIFDAITDPLIGYVSDNTNSKLGRRHPYLYASVLPLALSYFLLWHPPEFVYGDVPLFLYLVICNFALHLSMTMFLVPAYALAAELTSDYEERTRLLTRFHSVYSVVGNGLSVAMYAIWLVPTSEYADGIMNVGGYREAGLIGTLGIAISILVFAVGLHRFIPRLKKHTASGVIAPRQFFRQVRDVVRIPSLRAMIVSGMLYYAGTGTYAVLWVYIYSYFWEFTSQQISLIVIPMALGGLLLPPIMARLATGREKKRIGITGLAGAILVNVLPIALRLLDLFPANGTEILFWIMLTLGFFETVLFLVFDVCFRSMVADITEQIQLETGRRNEGIISAVVTFASKCARSLGTLFGGMALTIIAFPTATEVGNVAPEIIFNLGLVYGPLILIIWLGCAYTVSRYSITRALHSATVSRLADT